ncbi:hypothetical protein OIU78_023210 [Salix suchowensis]|nr:hypothetical protein OIU78_023210 [Salix suchowensis]
MELEEFKAYVQASKNHHQPHHLAEGHPLDHANIGRKAPSKSRFAPDRSREFDDVSVMIELGFYVPRNISSPWNPSITPIFAPFALLTSIFFGIVVWFVEESIAETAQA